MIISQPTSGLDSIRLASLAKAAMLLVAASGAICFIELNLRYCNGATSCWVIAAEYWRDPNHLRSHFRRFPQGNRMESLHTSLWI
jgi:hypothetical protein